MIAYTLIPLLVFVICCVIRKPRLNITHMVTTLIFISAFSSSWELLNVWRQWWVYDTLCDLMGNRGWILNKKLHVGIFFQYAISGFVIVYGSGTFFDKNNVLLD